MSNYYHEGHEDENCGGLTEIFDDDNYGFCQA